MSEHIAFMRKRKAIQSEGRRRERDTISETEGREIKDYRQTSTENNKMPLIIK